MNMTHKAGTVAIVGLYGLLALARLLLIPVVLVLPIVAIVFAIRGPLFLAAVAVVAFGALVRYFTRD